tara:strand:- start:415 stop:699 length:285 start_codon:yes stop_codon:yes gene_type:complete
MSEEQITNEKSFDKTLPKFKQPKKTIDEMSFSELKTYTKNLNDKKKKYIRKYQKTDKGKATTRVASQKYYKKKREEILAKKREYYLAKKKKMTN